MALDTGSPIASSMSESEDLLDSAVPGVPTLPNLPVTLPGLQTNNEPFSPPFKTDNLPNSLFDENPLGATLMTGTGGVPQLSTLKDPVQEAGWFAKAGHAMWENNRLILAGEFAYNQIAYSNSSTDEVPENFTAMNPDNVEGFPQKYWDFITDSRSPNDLKARQDRVREQMHNDEKFSNGSVTATLLGGLAGVMTDPTAYLIPMAVGVKYAGIAQNVFTNMGKSATGLAIDSLSRNMLIQADRVGGNLQDMATDSLRDFVFGTALVGIGAAAGGGLRASKLWNTRKVFNFAADGAKIDFVTNAKGEITGEMVMTPMPGVALSADVTSAFNLYQKEAMHMGGLFGVPYVGEGLKKALGGKWLGTPSMRAFNSPYATVKKFFNGIAPGGVITAAEAEGIARPDSAFHIADFFRGQAKTLSNDIRGLYYEANGLIGGNNTANALKNFQQTYSNNKNITEEAFGQEVRRVSYDKDYKSPYPQAHAAADLVHDFFDNMGKELYKSMGREGQFLDPRTAWRYLPQNYNIPAMINGKNKWLDVTINAYMKQDALIHQLNEPIRAFESSISDLKERMKSAKGSDAELKNMKRELKSLEMKLFKAENQQVETIRADSKYHILLEDRVMFDAQEREQLNQLLQPSRDAEVKQLLVEQRIEKLEKEKKKNKSDKKIVSDMNKQLKSLQKELEEAKMNVESAKQDLQDRAHAGEIDRKFFTQKDYEVEFHDPNKRPNLRKPFESAFHMQRTAEQVYESILNQTPEDLIQGVFGKMSPGIVENPSYLQSRTHLIDSEEYNSTGFLDPDISKSVTAYAATMGRIIGFKKAFPEFSDGVGYEGVLRKFKEEHAERVAALKTKEGTKEGNKERTKLQREYEEAEKFMSDTYKIYMGTYATRNPELNRFASTIKNLVVSAKMGSVPIYQMAELGAILMKAGVMPFLGQGLRPMIKSLNGWRDGPHAEAWKGYAADAHLASYTTMNGYAQRMVHSDTMSAPPITTASEKVGVWTDNLAHVSGNLFGTNYIANVNERWMASSFQSEVMRAMYAHQKGTITENQIVKMARYGIDVKEWSKRFVKNMEDAGGWSDAGGHQSLYYKWRDLEASDRMARSVRRAVHDTVVNGNIFTSPYWTNNPFGSMLFMFHGWAYGALNHYAIPLMQRPTAENMLGLISVVGLSLFAEPMLRMANGKDPYEDDTNWFEEAYKAVDYSGILGPYAAYLQDINNILGGALVPHLQTERAKHGHKGLGVLAGPVAGYLGDIASSGEHLLKGDWTQGDVKKTERLLPLSSHVIVRGLVNKWIEASGLPESRKNANQWSWRDSIYGEG